MNCVLSTEVFWGVTLCSR